MTLCGLLDRAKADGLLTDKAMGRVLAGLDGILCVAERADPAAYGAFLRGQHEALYGPHYDEWFAERDLRGVRYTGRDGRKREGAYWTSGQVEELTKGCSFGKDVTKWDRWVALNSYYADMCGGKTDEEVARDAVRYFFGDEDAPEGKVWRYMGAMR